MDNIDNSANGNNMEVSNNNSTGNDVGMRHEEAPPDRRNGGDDGMAMPTVFFGNLSLMCETPDVADMFERHEPPIPVERIDMKRGFCFVYLKDALGQSDKERIQRFVGDINGKDIERVSKQLRAEFARGDGRVKRKEDARRSNITPSETLFVVNFHVETTRKSDLELLFQPYGELIRIEMKKNYAFVQFATVEQAKTAKEATNGGKLDQSAISVEYVESRMRGGERGPRRDSRPRDDYRGEYRSRDRPREYSRESSFRDRPRERGPPEYFRGREERGRGDDFPPRRGLDRYDDSPRGGPRARARSPLGYDPRGRSRSRSRSPMDDRRPRYNNNDGYRDRDEYGGGRGGVDSDRRGGGGGRGGAYDRDQDSGRGRSHEREREFENRRERGGDRGVGGYDRGIERDRGYRSDRGYGAGGAAAGVRVEPGDEGAR